MCFVPYKLQGHFAILIVPYPETHEVVFYYGFTDDSPLPEKHVKCV